MVLKKTVLLSGRSASGRRELAVAEVTKRPNGCFVKLKKSGTVGLVTDGAADFAALENGGCLLNVSPGEAFAVGLFENGTLTLYGDHGRETDGRADLENAYKKHDSAAKNATSADGAPYDDFALAESDYYAETKKEKRKHERGAPVYAASEDPSPEKSDGTAAERGADGAGKDEDGDRRRRGGERETYYEKIRSVLDTLFYQFPRERELERAVADSTFVKILYAGDKYYVVGASEKDGAPEYVMFGVPAPENKKPPKEFGDDAFFVPCNVPEGGYFLLYRDAKNGNVLRKKRR